MHCAIRRGVIGASRIPARFIGGRRFSARHIRSFHSTHSTPLSVFPWGTDGQNSNTNQIASQEAEKDSKAVNLSDTAASEAADAKDAGETVKKVNANGRSRDYGSASRRWMRNRRPKDIPPIVLPSWFLERNVKVHEDEGELVEGILELTNRDEAVEIKNQESKEDGDVVAKNTEESEVTDQELSHEEKDASEPTLEQSQNHSVPLPTYRLNHAVMSEILSSISTGLSLFQPDSMDSFPTGKSHLKLDCPVDGGTYFLEKIVEESAAHLNADIIRLDAQDLADITSDYIKEGPEAKANSLWSLGYDSQQPSQRVSSVADSEKAEERSEAEAEEEAMEDSEENEGRPSMPSFHTVAAIPIEMGSRDGKPPDLAGLLKNLFARRSPTPGIGGLIPPSPDPMAGYIQVQGQSSSAAWNDHKLSALLETLTEANYIKKLDLDAASQSSSPGTVQNSKSSDTEINENTTRAQSEEAPKEVIPGSESDSVIKSNISEVLHKTIILIRGLKELSTLRQGRLILEKLVAIVQRKRKEGQQIMLIGTTSSSELTPEISRSAFENLQGEDAESVFRTLVVTPDKAGPSGGLFYNEERKRTREINVRNLHGMIRRLSNNSDKLVPSDPHDFAPKMKFESEQADMSDTLEEGILSFDEVHRIAIVAIGNKAVAEKDSDHPGIIQPHHLQSALNILDESDEAKTEWARSERHLQRSPEEVKKANTSPSESRMKKIKKSANRHEKTLMKGIVNPENLRTTFDDVHAPPETIEALKNLTSLSLMRPEAFKYGVLATDKLTGLLLYGPPGTGKTLLAKAVAKESGATVLEVSGSSLMDMYVGESEKNCRAVFSLAKKLTPCVVFIDEADAIFASRSSGSNRTSHREMINEFLREWDGMTDSNTFIMLATNRPFDLDDAALRRLPRRLLVDLPTEKDREAILAIHLKDEKLDPSISLAQLASQTPLYSGSDLKNLAVAAALAAVREENEMASKHNVTSKEPYKYPDRRLICQRHIDKALEEITASVSEDMSSLGAIRKFDDKYGDRRGRKKRAGYGFSTGDGIKEDTVKVRS